MTITITYKGITVRVDHHIRSGKIDTDAVLKIIKETIDKINKTCNNCTENYETN